MGTTGYDIKRQIERSLAHSNRKEGIQRKQRHPRPTLDTGTLTGDRIKKEAAKKEGELKSTWPCKWQFLYPDPIVYSLRSRCTMDYVSPTLHWIKKLRPLLRGFLQGRMIYLIPVFGEIFDYCHLVHLDSVTPYLV